MKVLIIIFLMIYSSFIFAYEYGIDQIATPFTQGLLKNKKIAVLAHAASVDKKNRHLIDLIKEKNDLKLILAPEHGLRTLSDDWIENEIDPKTKSKIISLYKKSSKAPRDEDLKDIDLILIDLQDVGLRFYTYFSTVAEVMNVACKIKIPIVILDRPNILGGNIVEGIKMDEKYKKYNISYHNIPSRHGMTLGELANLYNQEENIQCNLTVIKVKGWKREKISKNFDRSWTPSSPALLNLNQVDDYSLIAPLESLDFAMGRGKTNEMAFRIFGAPWILESETKTLVKQLNKINIDVQFIPYSWTVTRALHDSKLVHGAKIIRNKNKIRTDEFIFKVMSTLYQIMPTKIKFSNFSKHYLGSDKLIEAIEKNTPWDKIKQEVDQDILDFKKRRKKYLFY